MKNFESINKKFIAGAFLFLFVIQIGISTGALDLLFNSDGPALSDFYDMQEEEDNEGGKKDKKEKEEDFYTPSFSSQPGHIISFVFHNSFFKESFYNAPCLEIIVPPPSII